MSAPEKKKSFMGEFKTFIARGNVMDMAVGVIIGGAFGKISTSLVNDVIMPLISVLTGGVDFSNWKIVLKAAVAGADGVIDRRYGDCHQIWQLPGHDSGFSHHRLCGVPDDQDHQRLPWQAEKAGGNPCQRTRPTGAFQRGKAADGDPGSAEREMMEAQLRKGLTELGLGYDAAPSLLRFGELLLEKNKVMNLTAITDPEDVASLHFLDSAALLTLADLKDKTVVDVGTGAGFPGMPLKILEPSIRMTLLDSLGKRITFLQEVCDELGLQNVQCVHARAEEFAAEHRQSFDFAVSRAVANLSVLCELCLPLVKAGGYFLSMKSVESDEELESAKRAIQTLGGRVERTADYQIPGTEVIHRVIFIKKDCRNTEKIPRAFAKIKKNPL